MTLVTGEWLPNKFNAHSGKISEDLLLPADSLEVMTCPFKTANLPECKILQ